MRLTFEGTPLEFYEQFGFRPDNNVEVSVNSNKYRVESMVMTSGMSRHYGTKLVVVLESTHVKKRISRKGSQKDFYHMQPYD